MAAAALVRPAFHCYPCEDMNLEVVEVLDDAASKRSHNQRRHYRFEYECRTCLSRYSTGERAEYYHHYRNIHGVDPPMIPGFPCITCTNGYRAGSWGGLQQHYKLVHPRIFKKDITCRTCANMFVNHASRNPHFCPRRWP